MGAPSVATPAEPTLRVEVAYSPAAGEVDLVALQLPRGSTLADALRASGLAAKYGLDEASVRVGIWCKPKELDSPLRDRDRVEIYRPLRVDPKEARRQRYQRHRDNARAKGSAPGPGSAGR